MDYKHKYLKYKIKYFKLKDGGAFARQPQPQPQTQIQLKPQQQPQQQPQPQQHPQTSKPSYFNLPNFKKSTTTSTTSPTSTTSTTSTTSPTTQTSKSSSFLSLTLPSFKSKKSHIFIKYIYIKSFKYSYGYNGKKITSKEESEPFNLPYNYIWLLYKDKDKDEYYIKTLDNDTYLYYKIYNDKIHLNLNLNKSGDLKFKLSSLSLLKINNNNSIIYESDKDHLNFKLNNDSFQRESLLYIDLNQIDIKIKNDDGYYLGIDNDTIISSLNSIKWLLIRDNVTGKYYLKLYDKNKFLNINDKNEISIITKQNSNPKSEPKSSLFNFNDDYYLKYQDSYLIYDKNTNKIIMTDNKKIITSKNQFKIKFKDMS